MTRLLVSVLVVLLLFLANCGKETVKKEEKPIAGVDTTSEVVQEPALAEEESTTADSEVEQSETVTTTAEPSVTPAESPVAKEDVPSSSTVEETTDTVVTNKTSESSTAREFSYFEKARKPALNRIQSKADSIDVLYMIKPGDYLVKIALNEYGRASVWRRIWRWNYDLIGDNPNLIYPYNELTLKKPVEIANPVEYSFYEYTVQEGETLWDIAKKEYGSNFAWIVIVRDNFNTIGSNYDDLRPGTVLKLRTRLY